MKRLFALCSCVYESPALFLCLSACLTPFYHSSRSGSIPKGLILQGNLSFSQQRQTWPWGKSTLPWWSWSTTDKARSSARRLFVMSRYCCLKEKNTLLYRHPTPFKVKGRLTHWNQGCRAVVPSIWAWAVTTGRSLHLVTFSLCKDWTQ